jgi:hypothetical protein
MTNGCFEWEKLREQWSQRLVLNVTDLLLVMNLCILHRIAARMFCSVFLSALILNLCLHFLSSNTIAAKMQICPFTNPVMHKSFLSTRYNIMMLITTINTSSHRTHHMSPIDIAKSIMSWKIAGVCCAEVTCRFKVGKI